MPDQKQSDPATVTENRAEVRRWLRTALDVDSDDLDIANMGHNSLFAMEFLMRLENQYDIEIPTEALDNGAITVNSLTEVVCRLRGWEPPDEPATELPATARTGGHR